MEEKKDTYQLQATCANCNFSGVVDIPKGQKLEEISCPTCGNKKTLVQKPQTQKYYKLF